MSSPNAKMTTAAFVLAVLLECIPRPAYSNEQSKQSENEAIIQIPTALCEHMQAHHVLNPGAPVGCERLSLITFTYLGFDGQQHQDGEIIVMDAVANQVLQIFDNLRARGFPIASAGLMDEYNGDDEASMAANNTSSFNVRPIAGGGSISLHAYGAAIDLNPVQNPYLKRSGGVLTISPKSGTKYMNRHEVRPGMAESVIPLFANHGFSIWGGHWKNPIDYQHFQLSLALAKKLARLSSADAKTFFENQVGKRGSRLIKRK
ncbi:MAG TPA: M15 family metallopeptidase [Acidobacteriaceae bacterium]